MKKLIISTILVCLFGCCPVEDSSNYPEVAQKTISYKYPGSGYTNEINLRCVDFKRNDHDMLYYEGYDHNFCIIHSPDCEKCNLKNTTDLNSFLGW
jgi:hypothetical protein